MLLHLLEQNLDKDPRTAGCVFLIHVDNGQRGPADTVSREEVAKEPSNVSESIGLITMNGVVVVAKALFEVFGPFPMQFAEAFSHVAVEFAVGAFLGATLDDHVAQLDILAFGDLELEQLVNALFEIERGHDGQVDGPTQVDEVGLGSIVDLELTLGVIRAFTVVRARPRLAVCVGTAIIAVFVFAQDLCFDRSITLLVLEKLGVGLKDVQALLDVELIVQADSVGNLIILLNKVQRLRNARIVLKAFSTHLGKHLDHVLHTLADLAFVKDGAEAVEYAVVCFGCFFCEKGTNFAHEADCNLDTVICRLLK